VALLDELAVLVRERWASAEQLPLACILEGGTWAAGREIAAELRAAARRRCRSTATARCSDPASTRPAPKSRDRCPPAVHLSTTRWCSTSSR
jgi:hypothetical protein